MMSALPRSQTVKRAVLEDAFWSYVWRVKPIRQVMAVTAHLTEEFVLTTVIQRRNVQVCSQIFEVEAEFIERFARVRPMFDIRYANNRPLEEVVGSPSSYEWSWIRDANEKAAPRSSQT